MKQNFIKTSDSETASKMINLGFQKIDEQNGIYTFLNTGTIRFCSKCFNRTSYRMDGD